MATVSQTSDGVIHIDVEPGETVKVELRSEPK